MNPILILRNLVLGLILMELNHFSYSKLADRVLNCSQSVLYRFLNKAIEKQKLFQQLFKITARLLRATFPRGDLVIDNTTLDKSYSQELEGASYVWDNRKKRSVYGYSIILLIWVVNGYHIPVNFYVYVPGEVIPDKYTKNGRPKRKKAFRTHSEIACDLLSFARNRLKMKPETVLFDEYFASRKLFKLLNGYNWVGVFALPSNWCFEGKKLKDRGWYADPEWGRIAGDLKMTLIKDNNNYYGTNRYGKSRFWIKKKWNEGSFDYTRVKA
jgi:hypothetical protein